MLHGYELNHIRRAWLNKILIKERKILKRNV